MSPVPLPPERLTIATRESPLALWQAHFIADKIRALYPETEVSLLGLTTRGDQILDRTLSKVGGKGLFVKELELALLEGRADLAVHSMKDLPYHLPEEFSLAAITWRESPFDVLVSESHASFADLPAGAKVGTASLRREAQLRRQRPDITVLPVRGNLQTRLRRLDAGEFDALILAEAGLRRMGLAERIREVLPAELCLPSVGQGALGIEIASHRQELLAVLAPLQHRPTQACVLAERALSRQLAGNCAVPMAAFAETDQQGLLRLRGLVASADGTCCIEVDVSGPDPEALGARAAEQLLAQGAAQLLAQHHD